MSTAHPGPGHVDARLSGSRLADLPYRSCSLRCVSCLIDCSSQAPSFRLNRPRLTGTHLSAPTPHLSTAQRQPRHIVRLLRSTPTVPDRFDRPYRVRSNHADYPTRTISIRPGSDRLAKSRQTPSAPAVSRQHSPTNLIVSCLNRAHHDKPTYLTSSVLLLTRQHSPTGQL